MNAYEHGFALGEHAAHEDRDGRRHRNRITPARDGRMWSNGWWDGYTPRSAKWAAGIEAQRESQVIHREAA